MKTIKSLITSLALVIAAVLATVLATILVFIIGASLLLITCASLLIAGLIWSVIMSAMTLDDLKGLL